VFGRQELEKLAAQKQALLVESSVNRLALQAELQNLRSATAWLKPLTGGAGELAPRLLLLAPIAGFLLARLSRGSGSWLSRAATAAKWAGPLYGLWKRFAAARRHSEPGQPEG
jgi:hypothetical protein